MLNSSIRTGFSFGLTSGIITTLGLMVGLQAGTHSQLAVIGGILVIAIADAFSDALGIHISEESEYKHTAREVWESTLFTFITKFVIAITFIVPVLLLELSTAMVAAAIYGLILLGGFSFYIARQEKTRPWKVVGEHVFIALVVIVIAYYTGGWIRSVFV